MGNTFTQRFAPTLAADTRGAAGASYMMVALLVGVAGIGSFALLGTTMGTAIASDGGGNGMLVSPQAGEAGGPPSGTTTTTTTTTPSAVPTTASSAATTPTPVPASIEDILRANAAANASVHNGDSIDPTPPMADNDERRGGGILGGIWNGVVGVWDGAFETVSGLVSAAKSVVWDFLIEDVAGGILGPIAKAVVSPINAIFGTDILGNMSWIPLKDATLSVGHFLHDTPGGVWHAVTNVWHHGIICLNFGNHQSAGNRGYACGRLIPDIVNIVYGAKGLTKAAVAFKEAGLALRESAIVADTAEARVAAMKAAAKKTGEAGNEAKNGKPRVPHAKEGHRDRKAGSPNVDEPSNASTPTSRAGTGAAAADDLSPITAAEGRRMVKDVRAAQNNGLERTDPNYIGGNQNIAIMDTRMPELANLERYATSGGGEAQGGLAVAFDEDFGQMGRTIPYRDAPREGVAHPNPRMWDSERILMENILARTTPESTGVIRIFSNMRVCHSCSRVVTQFETLRPNIKLVVSSGKSK